MNSHKREEEQNDENREKGENLYRAAKMRAENFLIISDWKSF